MKCKGCGEESGSKYYCSDKCRMLYKIRSKNPKWIQQKKEANKRWYQKNKKRLIEKTREWKENNPERTKEINKKALKKFVASGKMNEYMRNHYKNNRDKYRIRCLTNYYKIPLMMYLKNKCNECGSNKNLEFHHIKYQLTDENKLDQLKKITLLLCKKCHKKLHLK